MGTTSSELDVELEESPDDVDESRPDLEKTDKF